MSINAYKRTIRESETPRQIEARVFARITGGMSVHLEAWNGAGDKAERVAILAQGLREVVSENRALWVRLQNDLSREGNQLPAALRANLISLSLWVDRTCGEVIGGGNGLKALIDVNQNIMGGLAGQSPAPAAVDLDGTQSHAQAV
ncbi:flagellar biosynthesis regulatory protein FlaF [Salipiger pallidus]|uniref:Flagellar biosynthesis regulatory protein FlaF n=1 Tax=Salipiger pallidus TaxID=1775170 RepID=A0A8J3EGH8_9RHOB|nr:flagellar biosynthesis regulator FlaF [Salipiger pallidus]GGG67740.1 flagellar biosynthesis regulatory protein FlaF [Salipiger pallidus]